MGKEFDQGGRGIRKQNQEIQTPNEHEGVSRSEQTAKPEEHMVYPAPTENLQLTESEKIFENTTKVKVERNLVYRSKDDEGMTEIEVPAPDDVVNYLDYTKDKEGNITSIKLKNPGKELVKKNWVKVFGDKYEEINTGIAGRTLKSIEKSLHSEEFTPSLEQEMFISQMQKSFGSRVNYAINYKYLQRIKSMDQVKYQLIQDLNEKMYGDLNIALVENFASASLRSLDKTIYDKVIDVTKDETELTHDDVHKLSHTFQQDIAEKMSDDLRTADEERLHTVRDNGLGKYPEAVLRKEIEDKESEDVIKTYIQENYKRILQKQAEEISKLTPIHVVITKEQVENKFLKKVKEKFNKINTKKVRRIVGAAILIGLASASCLFLYNLEQHAQKKAKEPSLQELGTQGVQNAQETQTAKARTSTPYVIYETEAPKTIEVTPSPKSYFHQTQKAPALPPVFTPTPFQPFKPSTPKVELPLVLKNYEASPTTTSEENRIFKSELPLIMKNYENPQNTTNPETNNQPQVKKKANEQNENTQPSENEKIPKHPTPTGKNEKYKIIKITPGETLTQILAKNGIDPYGNGLTQTIILNADMLSKHNNPEAVDEIVNHPEWTARGNSINNPPKHVRHIWTTIMDAARIIVKGAKIKIPIKN